MSPRAAAQKATGGGLETYVAQEHDRNEFRSAVAVPAHDHTDASRADADYRGPEGHGGELAGHKLHRQREQRQHHGSVEVNTEEYVGTWTWAWAHVQQQRTHLFQSRERETRTGVNTWTCRFPRRRDPETVPPYALCNVSAPSALQGLHPRGDCSKVRGTRN